jgi:hypothetical protein
MSILIDALIQREKDTQQQAKDGKWYCAKGISYFSLSRIKDAIRILTGKSRAYHYKEDE